MNEYVKKTTLYTKIIKKNHKIKRNQEYCTRTEV